MDELNRVSRRTTALARCLARVTADADSGNGCNGIPDRHRVQILKYTSYWRVTILEEIGRGPNKICSPHRVRMKRYRTIPSDSVQHPHSQRLLVGALGYSVLLRRVVCLLESDLVPLPDKNQSTRHMAHQIRADEKVAENVP